MTQLQTHAGTIIYIPKGFLNEKLFVDNLYSDKYYIKLDNYKQKLLKYSQNVC